MFEMYEEVIIASFTAGKVEDITKKRITEIYNSDFKNELFEIVKKRKLIPFVAKFLISLELDTMFWSKELDKFRVRNKNAFIAIFSGVIFSLIWFIIRPGFSNLFFVSEIEPMIVGFIIAAIIHIYGMKSFSVKN